jgi:alkyl hydroperoxide reductase subunit AhpF
VKELKVEGVFVGIGSVPNSDFIKNVVQTNENREIVINHLTAQTSKEGVFAAGDVTDDPFKQNNILGFATLVFMTFAAVILVYMQLR